MSEFEPRRDAQKPGLGRGFSVVFWTWLVLSLATGVVAAVATSLAVEAPGSRAGGRLRALETMGYVVRGEHVVDDGALVIARVFLAIGVLVVVSIVPYTIVVAARAGLRADAARADAARADAARADAARAAERDA